MKTRNPKKRNSTTSSKKPNKFDKGDSFFAKESKKRRKNDRYEEEDNIDSEDDDMEVLEGDEGVGEGEKEEKEEVEETAAEKRLRVASELVEKIRKMERRREDEGVDDDDDEGKGDRVFEADGERYSFVADKLMKEQLEDSGRLRRVIASRVQKPESVDMFEVLVKHRQSVTAVCLSDDDLKGFSASKDGIIQQWDVETGKGEKYRWPIEDILKSHGARSLDGKATNRSKNILALALSTDGRYLATGGLDRHIHLWDTRTLEHIQAFPGHRGPVSCLTFRQGTSELFSGSYDRSIKIWNVEDRAYVNTLFGHQSEVLTVDCLRKERVLAAGRDRSMQLFKVPEESRLIFRASASSLECCCFINNDEFLSGSDDGNLELWRIQKKKPVYIVKNAHGLLDNTKSLKQEINGKVFNGLMANCWVSSVAMCRGSDLAASGAGNGFVRLWAVESNSNSIQPLYDLPLVGFVNSLAIAKSGKFLVAGVGQEPRLGRWGKNSAGKNGVAIQKLRLS